MHIIKNRHLTLIGALAAFITSANADSGGPEATWFSGIDVFGRVMADYNNLGSTETSFAASGFELRRARIGASGSLPKAAAFKLEINISESGNVDFTDAFITYKPGGSGPAIQLGHFKTPNSIDEITSSRFITGHERPAFTDAFQLDRRVGAAIKNEGSQYTYFLGAYGQNINRTGVFGGYALAGRFTYNPAAPTPDLTVHTGVSIRYREVDSDQSELRYRQRPVSHIAGRIISTGPVARSDLFVGVEGAVLKKSFWLAGEYGVTFANCSVCAQNVTFDGGYIEAGYFFGGRRTYKKGRFDRPQLDGNRFGALSVFFRIDSIDLNDGPVNGGSYLAFVAGQDWWITDHVHVGANFFLADAQLGGVTSGLDPAFAQAIMNNVSDDVVKGVSVRAQFDF